MPSLIPGYKMANVILKNIKKVYDKHVVAVKDFNLEIKDKEFVVFVGPSGCGKSTTLRMIAGLEQISEGELYIDNNLMNDVAPKDRDIAMVFQNYALYPHMTVYNNMAFALQLKKVDKKEIDERVREAAKILGITEYLQRKPKALSGGQRQRVAIGRAIVRNPKVFLMDEPLSNLDAKLRNQMRAELIKLRKRVNTTFIYVTHDQIEAMTLGDRIVIMKDGVIQQIGTPQQVYAKPENVFVAGFIGTPQMNFFDGVQLKRDRKEYCVECFEKKIALTDEVNSVLTSKDVPAQEVKLGIRPEHIELADKEDESAIKAQLDVSELMGAESYLHLIIGRASVTVRVSNPDVLNSLIYAQNDAQYINITLPSSKLHIFEKESQNSLIYSSEKTQRAIGEERRAEERIEG